MIDQTLIYILIILMIAVLMLAMAVVIMYIKVTRKYLMLRTAGQGDKDETIIGNAKKIAEEIMANARVRAKEILTSAENVGGNSAEILDKAIKEATLQYIEKYTRALQESENKSLTGISALSLKISDAVESDIVSIRAALKEQLQVLENNLKGQIDKTYETLSIDLSAYKEMRLRQIDESIFEIVEEVSRKVLAKEINAEEHEKLVIKALEEAKKQNIFITEDEGQKSNIKMQNENLKI